MRLGSLFSGYGGLDLAVAEVLGASTAWVSDIEDGPRAILAERFPGVPNLGDITQVDWSSVEPVDVIAGGSPCQDVSAAGRRAGMRPGTRSGLWASMCDAVEIIRPSLVVWENVRGALSAGASSGSDVEPGPGCVGDGAGRPALRALGRVLGDLADIGYDAAWCTVRAADVGAPHGRARVFVLAWPADTDGPRRETDRSVAGTPQVAWTGRDQSTATDTADLGRQGHGGPRNGRAGSTHGRRPGTDATLLRTPTAQLATNGGSQHPAKRAAGGHGPTLADEIEHLLPTPEAADALGGRVSSELGGVRASGAKRAVTLATALHHLLPTPTATPYGSNQSMSPGAAVRPSLHGLLPTPRRADADATMGALGAARHVEAGNGSLAEVLGLARFGDYAPAISRWETVLGRLAPDPTEPTGRDGRPRLSPRFVEWMMGLADGWVTGVPGLSRAQILRALGNGVVPQQGAYALRWLLSIRAEYKGLAA